MDRARAKSERVSRLRCGPGLSRRSPGPFEPWIETGGLLGPWIYPLIGTNAFRDIAAGSNGAYNAGPGYDLCTGVGAPNVANLIAQIDQEITYSALPASPVDAGSSVALSAAAQLPGTYQWQLNGADIVGATGSTYVISNVKPG